MSFRAITIHLLRAFVLMMAILMPQQALSMTIATINIPCIQEGGGAAHCKITQMKQASSVMGEPCQIPKIAKNDSNQHHSNRAVSLTNCNS